MSALTQDGTADHTFNTDRHVQQKSTYARKTIENNELLLLVGFLLPQDKRLLVIFPRNV